jgi:hypothetical protein
MTPWDKSRWLSSDKIMHLVAGFFISIFFGSCIMVITAIGKEILDEYEYKGFDLKDLIMTLVGGFLWVLF